MANKWIQPFSRRSCHRVGEAVDPSNIPQRSAPPLFLDTTLLPLEKQRHRLQRGKRPSLALLLVPRARRRLKRLQKQQRGRMQQGRTLMLLPLLILRKKAPATSQRAGREGWMLQERLVAQGALQSRSSKCPWTRWAISSHSAAFCRRVSIFSRGCQRSSCSLEWKQGSLASDGWRGYEVLFCMHFLVQG